MQTNAFNRMNRVMDYIERHLDSGIDPDQIARIAGCPAEQFGRIFAFLANLSLPEYIRRRRLTLCAVELQASAVKAIDVATRYGWESPAAFSRAFRQFHGITPSRARRKDAVLRIHPRLSFAPQDMIMERGQGDRAVLAKVEIRQLPAARAIGIEVKNGGGQNPVPQLWEGIFQNKGLSVLEQTKPLLDLYVGWMGEYDAPSETFTYLAGYLMPANTPVPQGFSYRDLPPCEVGLGTINGSFANGDVFAHSHEMTAEGIRQAGYEPDYTQGWSAEAYHRALPFDAQEGTIHYLCPCKKARP